MGVQDVTGVVPTAQRLAMVPDYCKQRVSLRLAATCNRTRMAKKTCVTKQVSTPNQ